MLHSDDRLYFDTAPDSERPQPFIPTLDNTHGVAESTAVPDVITITTNAEAAAPPQIDETPWSVTSTAVTSEGGRATNGQVWLLLGYIGLGLLIGGSLHLWTRRKQRVIARITQSSSHPINNHSSQTDPSQEAADA